MVGFQMLNKKVKLCLIMLFAMVIVSCRNYVIPSFLIPGDNDSDHTHEYSTDPSGYSLKGSILYKVFDCPCGDSIEIAYRSGVQRISDQSQLANIDDNISHDGSRMVLAVGPDLAQDVLDRVGEDSTVILLDGDYDQLRIRNSRWQSDVRVAGDVDEGKYPGGNVSMETYLSELKDTYYPYYTREISNLEIIGSGRAVLNGGILLDNSNGETDPIAGRSPNGYYQYYRIDGLAFRNLTIEESNIQFEFQHSDSTVENVIVELCDFIGNETMRTTNNGSCYGFYMHRNSTVFSDIDFINCSFSDYFQHIRLETIVNSEIRGCSFVSSGHDSVELRGTTDENAGGEYVIENCFFDDISGKAIGRSGFSDADFIISGNDFNDIAPDEDEGYKSIILQFGDIGTSTEKQRNIDVVFSDNTYNGRRLENIQEIGYTADRFMIFAE